MRGAPRKVTPNADAAGRLPRSHARTARCASVRRSANLSPEELAFMHRFKRGELVVAPGATILLEE